MANFKDYDALTSEREAFVRRIGGEDIEFPKILPAKKMLDIRRKARKGLTEDEVEEMGFELIETVIGRERWDHVAGHLDSAQLGELSEDLMTYYGLNVSEEEEGKAETPATEELPSPSSESSPGGEHSTPTSNDSIQTPDESSTREDSTGTPSSVVSPIYPLAHSS